MNYIKQLEQERAELEALHERIAELRQHLQLPKFHHPENWISTDDVHRWLRYIESGSHT
jgi:hypothetical protein